MFYDKIQHSPIRRSSDASAARGVPRRGVVTTAAAAFLILGLSHATQAADRDLDPSFDGDGLVTLDIASTRNRLESVAVQPDGKIVAAGSVGLGASRNFAVARFNSDGSLDPGFGTDGINGTTDVSGANLVDLANALALQTDGKIVLVGQSGGFPAGQFAVARYDADGNPDVSFGPNGNGTVRTSFPGGQSIAREVTVQPDGKIVVAGELIFEESTDEGPVGDFALARYNPDGSLDTSFDGDGIVTTSVFPSNPESATGLAMQTDGKIVVAGFGGAISEGFDVPVNDFVLLRYNADGSLDPSFVATVWSRSTSAASAAMTRPRPSSFNRTASWSWRVILGWNNPTCLHSRA